MRPAEELLAKYGDDTLLSELALWETARAAVSAPRYQTPPQANARTLISLDGIPGAGKSTTQKWLMPAVGAEYLSMARFAEARGVTADERRQHQVATGEPHGVDEEFLATLARSTSRYVLLEKFPRSVVEAVAVLRAASQHGWRFEVLHLQLPGDCVALSTRRQLDRGPRHGRMPEPAYAQHRALVHLARATSGRETLRASGVPIHAFDMTQPLEENAAAVRRVLGLDFDALGWNRVTLDVLARVSAQLGIEAWVTGGTLYRPFWNNRFGPAQRPTDVDVAVDEERESAPLLRALEREAPHERWSVLAPSERLRERYHIETRTAAEAKSYATFQHRAGLVRLRDGRAELTLPPGTEAALWSGTVALNPALLERVSEGQRRELLERETHHLPRALADYPGLRVAAETARLFEGRPHWRDHAQRPIITAWRALKRAVGESQRQRGGAAVAFCRRALGPRERELALRILRFHRQSRFEPEAPPLPERAEPLAGRLSDVARDATDAGFAAWFLEQVHHHRPAGGADPFLKSVLDLSLFGGVLKTLRRDQSPMHQGWPLERHLAQSVLQLRTDELLMKLEAQHGRQWCGDLRLCMRMAMLFHDTGKLLGTKPRRHALISARLFARLRPEWFPERLVELTQWLIRTHDLFGAFGRGLTDRQYGRHLGLATSYFGALDSQAVRGVLLEAGLPLAEAAAINKQLWCADVGSIAALRWLLPVAEWVEKLLLVEHTARVAGIDRRKRQIVR